MTKHIFCTVQCEIIDNLHTHVSLLRICNSYMRCCVMCDMRNMGGALCNQLRCCNNVH